MVDCCATCTSWHENAGADFGECRNDGSPRMGEYTNGARVVCDQYSRLTEPLNTLRTGLAALADELANPPPPPPAEEDPAPEPDPVPDPVPEPDPEPVPDPEPEPQPDPAPDPTPETPVEPPAEPVTVPEEPTNG